MSFIFPTNTTIELVKAVDNASGHFLNKNTSLYKKIKEQLNYKYHKSVIKLAQCSRNLVENVTGPNVLFLSNTDGGFAKRGLTIVDKNQQQYYARLNYVDLMINEQSLVNGKLNIFSHELAHVKMSNILPELKEGKSTMQHLSVAITDENTAFIEGFAIQFERFAYDNVKLYRDLFNKDNNNEQIIKLWQSELDSGNRINGVVDNRFIYQNVNSSNIKQQSKLVNKLILEHTSPMFNKLKLKNAQQLLACEGVIATLFYRINSNEKLQNNYLEASFYNHFTVRDIPNNLAIKDIFTPFENVILKNLWVLYQMRDNYKNKSLMINFIETWISCFPQDKQELINIFISTTLGKTVDNSLSDIYEQLAYAGMIGDIAKTRIFIKQFKDCLQNICEKVTLNEVKIDNNVGKELWLTSNIQVPVCFWQSETKPLNVNVNTASSYMLMAAYNISYDKALNIINRRNKQGYFTCINEIKLNNIDL